MDRPKGYKIGIYRDGKIKENKMKFGDYVQIEQKRYGVENEMYTHKVINVLMSNNYVDIPVQTPAKETLHKELVPVLSCICCGVDEKKVLHYKETDCKGE